LKILKEISKKEFNFLVITGDISFRNPSLKIYRWVKQKLDILNKNYFLIPGNHDKIDYMGKVFGYKISKNGNIFYKHEDKKHVYLFLDSSKNIIDKEQINYIFELSKKNRKKNVVIFMHHPPLIADCKYMDKYFSLKNIKNFQKAILKVKNISHIFCGHYHCDKELNLKDIRIHINPSTFFQIDCKFEDFNIESYLPGYRIIYEENNFKTETKYLMEF